ncbi:hypothetical protein ACWV26_09145 [Rummeliibacillus sp. JY-2-4R]
MQLIFLLFLSALFFIFTFIVPALSLKLFCLLISFTFYKLGSHQIKLAEIRRNEEIKQDTEKILEQYPHSQSTISSDYLHALLIGEASQTLFVANREDTDSEFDVKEYLFNEIFETAIEEDGIQKALISRGGILGGTLLDSDGNGNSLIYIMEPEKDESGTEEKKDDIEDDIEDGVSKLSLKIVVDDLSNPIIEYVFLESEDPVSKECDEYEEASKLCKKWHQMISVLIKRQDHLNKVIIKRYEHSNKVV